MFQWIAEREPLCLLVKLEERNPESSGGERAQAMLGSLDVRRRAELQDLGFCVEDF